MEPKSVSKIYTLNKNYSIVTLCSQTKCVDIVELLLPVHSLQFVTNKRPSVIKEKDGTQQQTPVAIRRTNNI